MPSFSRLRAFFRNLLRRRAVDLDLKHELASYAALVADDARNRGASVTEATRLGALAIGGRDAVTEQVRDVRTGARFDQAWRDLRIAIRSLTHAPTFAVVAILTLAIGIGANTAILSVIGSVLLRPLDYPNADRLVTILERGKNPVSAAEYVDWRENTRSFASMGAAEYWTVDLTGTGTAEEVTGLRLTASVLPMIGTHPLLGRVFTSDEDRDGVAHVAVIGYSLWQRRFGGDSAVVGRSMLVSGEPYSIIGVMPATFRFAPFWATEAELWAPLALGHRMLSRDDAESLRIFAQLGTGVTLDRARAEMTNVTAKLARAYPGTNQDIQVVDLREKVVGDARQSLLVLTAAVVFVLLIACANVAHMVMSRMASRERELAVRAALGASRTRLISQMLTESAALAALGGLLGFAFAYAGVRGIVALSPASLPRVADIGIDWRVLAAMIVVTALTAIGFGLGPAIRAGRIAAADGLREGARGSTRGSAARVRGVLVTSEFALACVLLIGAGLMIRSMIALGDIDPGLDPRNVLTATLSIAGTSHDDSTRRASFFADVLDRVRQIPGVSSASVVNHLPIAGDEWRFSYRVEGHDPVDAKHKPSATYRVAFPEYFRTMGAHVVQGRDFTNADQKASLKVVVVNETMARHNWPGQNPIGKRIAVGDTTWRTVVGVVRDMVRDQWPTAPGDEVFLPYRQSRTYFAGDEHAASMSLVAKLRCDRRGECDATGVVAAIKGVVSALDADAPVSHVATMASVVETATGTTRFYLRVLELFAAIAVMLACGGVYGVISYSVALRTREIGIRLALGADSRRAWQTTVTEGLRMATIGGVIGIVAALGLTKAMSRLLFGVTATDPLTFAGVAIVLIVVAAAASFVPARRAASVDPVEALRSD